MSTSKRTAVVTGGSRGIGRAIALELAARGVRVVVSARTTEAVGETVAAIEAAGGSAVGIPCDVSSEESVRELGAAAREAVGTLDILINNAGMATSAPVKAITLEEWNRVYAVNVAGVFLCTREFLPQMLANGWGRIVNVASIAGKQGAAYISLYSSSKHAVIGFTRSVAAEVAKQGVTVNAVCPGYVATDMMELALSNIQQKTGANREQALESLYVMSPQHRVYQPEEIAFATANLCEERAGGVSGQSIVIDGGAVQT